MKKFKRALTLVLALVLLAALPAVAAPRRIKAERSDNTYTFVYDADDDEIVEEQSSAEFGRHDRLQFFVYIRERPDDAEGAPLAARLHLRLLGSRAMRFKGEFWLRVKTAGGITTLEKSKAKSILLRPRPGERRRVIHFRFGVDSGAYRARAGFRAG